MAGQERRSAKSALPVDKIRVEVDRRYQELMQADGYRNAINSDAYRYRCQAGNFAEAVRGSLARGFVEEESQAQQVQVHLSLSDDLQPYSGFAPCLQA